MAEQEYRIESDTIGEVKIPKEALMQLIKQFLVDFDLFGNAQAIRHLHDVNTIKEGFVVFVITESDPFGFVRVGENNPVERQGGDTFRPVVVTFLSGG